jgi:hypothetical protein
MWPKNAVISNKHKILVGGEGKIGIKSRGSRSGGRRKGLVKTLAKKKKEKKKVREKKNNKELRRWRRGRWLRQR